MPSVLNTAVANGPGLAMQDAAIREVFSAEIWFAALPVLKFDQFTTKKTELMVQPGNTIVMPKFGNIKRGGPISEDQRIQARSMSQSSISVKVGEYTNALSFSEYLLQTSFYDQMTAASMALGRDFAVVLDLALRDAFRQGLNVVWPNKKGARSDLTPGAQPNDLFSTQLIKDVKLVLATNNAPKWGGDHYICFAHPNQIRSLTDDADWINVNNYNNAQAIYQGEIGRYQDIRFIETTVMPNGADSTVDPETGDYVSEGYDPALAQGANGNQAPVYQAIFFGQFACGHATALPVELRDNGVQDYGREHGLAWYSIFGQTILENKNVVIAETLG